MAGQNRPPAALFPTPPPFYQHFTKDNISQLREKRKEAGVEQLDPASLPESLQRLLPPEAPPDERYKSFGVPHDLSQPSLSLSEAGIEQLYPTTSSPGQETDDVPDPTPHLLTLTRSILVNFLEMIGTLSVNPDHAPEKHEHIQTIFYNVHDLINQYRPHQARESLILMMEEQLDRFRSDTARIKGSSEKLQTLLRKIQEDGNTAAGAVEVHHENPTDLAGADTKENARREAQRSQWAALEEELG